MHFSDPRYNNNSVGLRYNNSSVGLHPNLSAAWDTKLSQLNHAV